MADEETVITRGDSEGPKGPQNAKERVYEKLRMPIPVLDGIIVALVIALAAALILGFIKGQG